MMLRILGGYYKKHRLSIKFLLQGLGKDFIVKKETNMEKRNIYILIGAGIVLIVLIVLTLALGSQKQQTLQNLQTQTGQLPPQTTVYNELPPPTSNSPPEEIAKGFYNWYVSHPNPLGSGDYQKSPYLTEGYKESMTGFVARGD